MKVKVHIHSKELEGDEDGELLPVATEWLENLAIATNTKYGLVAEFDQWIETYFEVEDERAMAFCGIVDSTTFAQATID